jgi:signal transduction histidine kinase
VPPLIKIYAEPVKNERIGDVLIQPDEFTRIVVEDNGIGFKLSLADEIFKTFIRLNSKDKFEGTGLGLSLCKKIAERHGGAIEAQSEEGQGSRFNVMLPIFEPRSFIHD